MLIRITSLSCVFIVCCAQSAGDPCTDQGRTGTCVKITNCQSAIDAIQKKQNPKICGFDKSDAIVCCFTDVGPTTVLQPVSPNPLQNQSTEKDMDSEEPDYEEPDYKALDSRGGECQPIPAPTAKKTGQKAFDKCIEYQEKYIYPCTRGMSILGSYSRSNNCHHNADELIIGGEAAGRDEFPHMAMLRYGFNERTKQYMCGGAIISENYVLTAGHCIAPSTNIDVTHVIVGALALKEANDQLKRYSVKKRITHPEYKPPFKYNDIALLETERPMKLSQYVVPACLHVGDQIKDDRVLATGWGQTKDKDASSVADVLQKVILDKFDLQACELKYIPNRHLDDGIQASSQLCYGHKNESRDTCQGDSGGPIQIKSEKIHCMYVIVGLTSFGKGCGFPGDPAVYTKVSNYIPWIESIVWP